MPDTPQTLADVLAQWATDTLAHQGACLALRGDAVHHLTPLPACHVFVERVCQVLLSGARGTLWGGERPILLLSVCDLADCPDDLLPSLERLQELAALNRLGGARLALPGILATRLALCRGRALALSHLPAAHGADDAPGEHTPLLPVARDGGATDRCVVS